MFSAARAVGMSALLVSAILLSGCLGTITKVDTAIGNTTESAKFRQTCYAIESANLVFVSLSNYPGIAEKISQRTRTNVEAAYAVANDICTHPPRDTTEALVQILAAYNTIMTVQKSVVVTAKNNI